MSAIAKILVPVTGAKRDLTVVNTAITAAKPFGAHVQALFVHPNPYTAIPYMGTPVSPTVTQEIADAMERLAREAEKRARTILTTAAAAANVKIVDKPLQAEAVTCSFRSMEGFAPGCVGEAATLADLVVFGPLSDADGTEIAESFFETLMRTDRPVLISPDVPARLGEKVAIGWDGGRAAAHAVMAALPFLRRAAAVEVLSVQRSQKAEIFADLAEYLALHGIKAETRVVEKGAQDTGVALLDAATRDGVDLLVIGGYGHSYWRETLFGGVTAHVRWHAKIPVLMVH